MSSQPLEARNVVNDEHFIGKTHKIFTLKSQEYYDLHADHSFFTSLLLRIPLLFITNFASVFITVSKNIHRSHIFSHLFRK